MSTPSFVKKFISQKCIGYTKEEEPVIEATAEMDDGTIEIRYGIVAPVHDLVFNWSEEKPIVARPIV